mmetsp:Transcript_30986/g.36353  ORF Transcript_30986/g.36353 Transcript_30986/m.36353 type:complete len:97 (+) Transcript_30986:503-793(+)
MHLHLSELLLLLLSSQDFLLKFYLFAEVLLLKFAQLADLLQLLLVACQGFTHGELVLVTVHIALWSLDLCVAHCELLPAWWQVCRAILQKQVGSHW